MRHTVSLTTPMRSLSRSSRPRSPPRTCSWRTPGSRPSTRSLTEELTKWAEYLTNNISRWLIPDGKYCCLLIRYPHSSKYRSRMKIWKRLMLMWSLTGYGDILELMRKVGSSFVCQVIVLSHRYKCRAYWPRPVRAAEASSTWSPDIGVLRVRAPVSRISGDLSFWEKTGMTVLNVVNTIYKIHFLNPYIMNHDDGWHSFELTLSSLSVS